MDNYSRSVFYRALLFWCMALCSLFVNQMSLVGQHYWWSAIYNPEIVKNNYSLTWDSEWGIIAWGEYYGVWAKDTGSHFNRVITEETFNSFYKDTRIASNGNGTIYIVGRNRYDQSKVSIGVIAGKGSDMIEAPDSLTSKVSVVVLRTSDRIVAFSQNVACIEELYSTDGGKSWQYCPDPSESGRLSNITFNQNEGFMGYSVATAKWYELDLPTASWKEKTLDKAFTRIVNTHSGVQVGIESLSEYDQRLYYKLGTSGAWTLLDSVVRNDNKKIPVRSLFGIGGIFTDHDTSIIVAIDSGVVAYITERGVEVISLPDSAFKQLSPRTYRSYSRSKDKVCMLYGDDIYVVDLTHGSTKMLRQQPTIGGSDVCQAGDTTFILSRTTNGQGWLFDADRDVWYADLKLEDEDLRPYSPIAIVNLQGKSEELFGLTGLGQCVSFSTTDKTLILTSSRTLLDTKKVSDQLLGLQRLVVTHDGYTVLGSTPTLVASDVRKSLNLDTATAFAVDDNNSEWSGYKRLYRRDGRTSEWDTLSFRDEADTAAGPVSTVSISKDNIVVGARGYLRTYSGDTLATIGGGLFISHNGGQDFVEASLSTPGTWFESVWRSSSGTLFAWQRVVEVKGGTLPNSPIGIYEDEATLIRSSDNGSTWTQAWGTGSLGFRTSTLSTWRFGQHQETIYTLFPPNSVLYSTNDGLTWNEKSLDFDVDVIYDLSLSTSGDLVLGTSDGIHISSLQTSVDNAKLPSISGPTVIVYPNPNTSRLCIKIQNTNQEFKPIQSCQIIDLLGSVKLDVTADLTNAVNGAKGEVVINTENWASGVYLLIYVVDGKLNTKKIVKSL